MTRERHSYISISISISMTKPPIMRRLDVGTTFWYCLLVMVRHFGNLGRFLKDSLLLFNNRENIYVDKPWQLIAARVAEHEEKERRLETRLTTISFIMLKELWIPMYSSFSSTKTGTRAARFYFFVLERFHMLKYSRVDVWLEIRSGRKIMWKSRCVGMSEEQKIPVVNGQCAID